MSKTALQRLEEQLSEREEKIAELEKALETAQYETQKAEERADANQEWTRHRYFEKGKEQSPALPVPRLEIRWVEQERDGEGYEVRAEYSLVYRHLLGQVIFVPLGMTRSTGNLASRTKWGDIELPFRDGVHFGNEMKQLRLRGFAICGDEVRWRRVPRL